MILYHKLTGFVIAILLAALFSKDIEFDIRGIPEDKLMLYNFENSFRCLNDSSKVFPLTAINDDYCDCPDGSDEPGTSACKDSKFYCENNGYLPQYILSSRINDNVCDEECCDGSDEYNSLTKCPNVCTEKKEQYFKLRNTEYETLKSGLTVKKKLVEESIAKKEKLKQELKELEPELEKLNFELTIIKKKKDEKQSILDKQSNKKASEQTNDENVRLHEQNKILREIVLKLNSILNTLKTDHNPNYHDMAVKRSILEHQQISDKYQIYLTNTTESDLDQPFVHSDYVHESRDEKEAETDTGSGVQELEKEIQNLEIEINGLDEAIEKTNEKIEAAKISERFPSNDTSIASVLFDQCYETTQGKYTYSMCLNHDIMQRSDTENILLGHYHEQQNDSYLLFTNGQNCWNGPDRSVKVNLICHKESAITNVAEPNKCKYKMTFLTPMACEESKLQDYYDLPRNEMSYSNGEEQFKDEL